MVVLECPKDKVMKLKVLRLIRIISILSNLEIRMDGMIVQIEKSRFRDTLFLNLLEK